MFDVSGIHSTRTRVVVVWLAVCATALWAWMVLGSTPEVAILPGGVTVVSGEVSATPPLKSEIDATIYSAQVTTRAMTPLSYLLDHLEKGVIFRPSAVAGVPSPTSTLSAAAQGMVAAGVAASHVAHHRVVGVFGVVVRAVLPSSPLAGVLHVGDVIVSVNGASVVSPDQFIATVERDAASSRVFVNFVTSSRVGVLAQSSFRVPPRDSGSLGLVLGTGEVYRLGFVQRSTVSMETSSDANLAVALSLLSHPTHSSLGVCSIGVVLPDGEVSAVPFVVQQVLAAAKSKIRYVLVPSTQEHVAQQAAGTGMEVIGVHTLGQAVSAIKRIESTAGASRS